MNKKYIAYLVLGIFLIGAVATLSASMVAAQGDVEVGQNTYQIKQQAGEEYTYRFRMRTRLRINSSAPVDLNMDVDALNIGEHTFSIRVLNATQEIEMNMTCKQNTYELGIQNGSTFRYQERNQVRSGFAIQIQTNMTVKARIGFEMTQGEARRANWAYFDEGTEEWVAVESSYEDGELVAETEHFSVWTIAESNIISAGIWAVIGVGIVAVTALAVILIRKKKVQVIQ
ncbi:MAG: hypothetical protein JW776_01095 [Candidatus Lokiarchaeota archaeon]|nr:hypothetical protein [Candidatus Lokiarchaeota archaeon]